MSARAARRSRQVSVGGVLIGGGAPIVVQSMTNTDTADAAATARQVAELARELRPFVAMDGQRADDVARDELQLGEAIGLEPDAHRIVLGAENLHQRGAGNALDLVEHVEGDDPASRQLHQSASDVLAQLTP